MSWIDLPPAGDTFSPSILLGEHSLLGVAALRSSGFPSSRLLNNGIGYPGVGRSEKGNVNCRCCSSQTGTAIIIIIIQRDQCTIYRFSSMYFEMKFI